MLSVERSLLRSKTVFIIQRSSPIFSSTLSLLTTISEVQRQRRAVKKRRNNIVSYELISLNSLDMRLYLVECSLLRAV